ncbi:MAG TPA: phosphotransferase family protein [Candidatus Dormibacteraeota bacterium]
MPDAAVLESAWPGARIQEMVAIPESHSGFTYMVTALVEGTLVEGVLRVPPPGARPVGPADVVRQGRIMAALSEAGVPVPRVLAMGEEPPFLVMERVAGVRVEEALAAASARALISAAFAAARRLHEVPLARTGIGEEPVMAPGEEVRRWQALRVRAPEELLRGAERLEERLLSALPALRPPALVHGDFHLGNLLFQGSRVVAILDWEIAEMGSPPLDEAALCLLAIRAPFGEPQPGAEAALPLEEMVSLADAGPDFDWYLAATSHKYAAILGYNLGLHRRGRRIDPVYEQLLRTIPGLVDAGLQLVG